MLQTLQHNKAGLTIEALAGSLGISRNAVRQHLTALERDGLVARGVTKPSGGRPEQLYVLTSDGMERFPRRYSWFSDLLLQSLQAQLGSTALGARLAEIGRSVAEGMKARLPPEANLSKRLAAISKMMEEIGYDTTPPAEGGEAVIEARNCVFHELAAKSPAVCSFDLAFLSATSGCRVEHCSCMVRGDDACRFRFHAESINPA